ncbi:MAG: hypothetical protein DLM72_18835 [Candidatus Nitrosopolaris wilkensis]|nr:MAG: hypothetical protein DLM72_18835 [Candidatus Nitrosopolaris wilkensis]
MDSWDIRKREELGIRGPINPDGTIHKCYPTHKEPQQIESTSEQIAGMTQHKEEVEMPMSEVEIPAAIYQYEVKIEQSADDGRITVHCHRNDPDLAIKQA